MNGPRKDLFITTKQVTVTIVITNIVKTRTLLFSLKSEMYELFKILNEFSINKTSLVKTDQISPTKIAEKITVKISIKSNI